MLISTPIPADPARRAQVLASRAACGAAALDAQQPGWAARIVPDQIDLASDGNPLTLLYDDFHDGLLSLVHADPEPRVRAHPYAWAVTHGFDLDASVVDPTGAYAELDACWRMEIVKRRLDRIAGEAR
jgi:hypothetical protein